MSTTVQFCSLFLGCIILGVQSWDYSEDPAPKWVFFESGKSKFALEITAYNTKDVCEPYTDPATNKPTTLCETDVRTKLYEANRAHGDDYDLEHTKSECAISGNLPPNIKRVCWIRVQRASWRKIGLEKKTETEIQVWKDPTSGTTQCRYSSPYE